MKHSRPIVVVVDNSPSIKTLFEYSTARLDIELKVFDSAESSLAYLSEHRPALLFLSIIMPDKDGLTLLRELREKPLHRETPVVMISSKDYAQDRHVARELGALEFIPKPMPMQIIRETVQRYVH